MAEVCDVIAGLERTGAATTASRLQDWPDIVLQLFGHRVIPFDIAAARLAGRLTDKARAAGQSPGFADHATATAAGGRGLTVLKRSVRLFAPLDNPAVDPYESLPRWLPH